MLSNSLNHLEIGKSLVAQLQSHGNSHDIAAVIAAMMSVEADVVDCPIDMFAHGVCMMALTYNAKPAALPKPSPGLN